MGIFRETAGRPKAAQEAAIRYESVGDVSPTQPTTKGVVLAAKKRCLVE